MSSHSSGLGQSEDRFRSKDTEGIAVICVMWYICIMEHSEEEIRRYSKTYLPNERDTVAKKIVDKRKSDHEMSRERFRSSMDEWEAKQRSYTPLRKWLHKSPLLMKSFGIRPPDSPPINSTKIDHVMTSEMLKDFRHRVSEKIELDKKMSSVAEFCRAENAVICHVLTMGKFENDEWITKLKHIMSHKENDVPISATAHTYTRGTKDENIVKDNYTEALFAGCFARRRELKIGVWLKGGKIEHAYPLDAGTGTFRKESEPAVLDEELKMKYISHTPLSDQVHQSLVDKKWYWNEYIVDIRPEDVGGIFITDLSIEALGESHLKELLLASAAYSLPIAIFTRDSGFLKANVYGKREPTIKTTGFPLSLNEMLNPSGELYDKDPPKYTF